MIRIPGLLSRRLAAAVRRALPLALALLVGSTWPVWAQAMPGDGQLAIRSDGFVYWIQNGTRHLVYPAPLSDQQINALPEGAPLNAALLGDAPAAGQPAAPPQRGTSRADRLALFEPCACYLIRGTGQRSDVAIQIVEVQREAWANIIGTNPSNQPPRDGYEYVMLTLRINYTSGPRDLPLAIDRFDFTLIDSNDTLYQPAFVLEPQPLMSTTTYPGSEIYGQVAYLVPRGNPDLVLVWRYNHDRPVWFAIS